MKKGFTIIELLIVIAIIAVLAAILFPAFTAAKDSGNRTAALAQSKQLATSLLLYLEDADNMLPPSTNYAAPATAPDRMWTTALLPYVKEEKLFVAPASQGKFAKTWEGRGWQTVGYNSSTAFDPTRGCVDGETSDDVSCLAFKSTVSFSKQENSSAMALFAVTPGGEVKDKYLGYEFSPYNNTPLATDPKLTPPLTSDRDLVKELSDLPAEFIKPIHARYQATGRDQGFTPVVFGDGHVKDYSARQITQGSPNLIWRLR